MATIPCCCDCGVGQQLQLQIRPLARELPYAMGVVPQKNAQESPGEAVKMQILTGSAGQGLGLCISNKLPASADGRALQTPFSATQS